MEPSISLKILVPVAGKDYCELKVPIREGERFTTVLERVEPPLDEELAGMLFANPPRPYALAVNDRLVRLDKIGEIRLKDEDEVKIFALCIGG